MWPHMRAEDGGLGPCAWAVERDERQKDNQRGSVCVRRGPMWLGMIVVVKDVAHSCSALGSLDQDKDLQLFDSRARVWVWLVTVRFPERHLDACDHFVDVTFFVSHFAPM